MTTDSPEQWRPVLGWEGRYEVSDHGRVRSLAHSFPGRPGVTMTFPTRIISGSLDSSNHVEIALNRGPKRTLRRVHILVLEAFVGPRPTGMFGCHYDDDPTNNQLANLRWDTPSANTHDKVRNGRHPMAKRTHCPLGHPYSEENTYRHPNGSRSCRTCRREQNARRYRNARDQH